MALQSSEKKPIFPRKDPLHATKSADLYSLSNKPATANGQVCSEPHSISSVETKQQATEVIGKMVFQQIILKSNKTKFLLPSKLPECSVSQPEALPLNPPGAPLNVPPVSPKKSIPQPLSLKKTVSLPVTVFPKKTEFPSIKPVAPMTPLKPTTTKTCTMENSDGTSLCPLMPTKPLPDPPNSACTSSAFPLEKCDLTATQSRPVTPNLYSTAPLKAHTADNPSVVLTKPLPPTPINPAPLKADTVDNAPLYPLATPHISPSVVPLKPLPPTPMKPDTSRSCSLEKLDITPGQVTPKKCTSPPAPSKCDITQICYPEKPDTSTTSNSPQLCPSNTRRSCTPPYAEESDIMCSQCPLDSLTRPVAPLTVSTKPATHKNPPETPTKLPKPLDPGSKPKTAPLLPQECSLMSETAPISPKKPLPLTPVKLSNPNASLTYPLSTDPISPCNSAKPPKVPPKYPEDSINSWTNETDSPSSDDHELAQIKNRNGFRNSLRLIRIEPSMGSHSNGHVRLSALDEAEQGGGSFPCSMSPSTLQSMELLFSFSDADILEKLSDSWPVKCSYVVKELIMTERAYVQALADIIEGYLTRLYSYVLETGESPNFIRTVFGNVVKIHQIHISLLAAMQSVSTKPAEFARVFMECDILTQYTIYCTNYSSGNSLLEKVLSSESDMKHFIVKCQRDLNHTLPLTSYLIKPVQRILKYPLLLDDLSRKFNSSETRASHLLKRALEKMSSAAVEINTAFNHPVKGHKHDARQIVQKRLHQVRELQKSRSMDRASTADHSHSSGSGSHSLPRGYGRGALFPVPSNSLDRLCHLEDKTGASAKQSSIEACVVRKDSGVKPAVRDLKKFYDKLTENSQEEMRHGSICSSRQARASSLEESFVTVSRPSVTRTSSVGNLLKMEKKNSVASDNKPEHKSLMKWFARSKKSKKH